MLDTTRSSRSHSAATEHQDMACQFISLDAEQEKANVRNKRLARARSLKASASALDVDPNPNPNSNRNPKRNQMTVASLSKRPDSLKSHRLAKQRSAPEICGSGPPTTSAEASSAAEASAAVGSRRDLTERQRSLDAFISNVLWAIPASNDWLSETT